MTSYQGLFLLILLVPFIIVFTMLFFCSFQNTSLGDGLALFPKIDLPPWWLVLS